MITSRNPWFWLLHFLNDPTINSCYMWVIKGILLSIRNSREQFLNPIIVYYDFNVQISIYGRRVLRGRKNNIWYARDNSTCGSSSSAADDSGKRCCHLPILQANLVINFAAFGRHSSLWPKATTFERSQRPFLRPSAAIVRCGRRPQQLRGHRYRPLIGNAFLDQFLDKNSAE